MKKLLVSICIIGLVVACKKNDSKPSIQTTDSTAQVKKDSLGITQTIPNKEEALKKTNDEVLQALKNKDYQAFAALIHPQKGIRFSMYAFVDKKEDKHFSKADFEKFQPTKTLFTWGAHDGSGDPYKATINDYILKWVFSKDFTKGQYSLNTFIGGGNSLNNLKEMYPGDNFTENFLKGTEKYGEMDWKTIRLVFEEFEGKYYVIAVVNDQWTI
ncbi:hypothetical protein C1637_18375 [Chryseobacterium lactis]|uniref:Lipoprotein n=1 Tax=Chryseobacterium lactis TaxID=1241981 RepID=A0A3G6RPH6_CHRLC|nr:hypothetical protein [Chryseobacterium lactis]AZA84750.1 hypothetical protein EG342_23885 [Chryseobacterium lactis]AZB05139.1 hypothetical protein EG341_14765 [Chryseobacterium lactis]PNW12121.1 hypothetical protein C1637_18375 [Chryseobacterium lactis]